MIRTAGLNTDSIVLRHTDENAVDAAVIVSPVPIINGATAQSSIQLKPYSVGPPQYIGRTGRGQWLDRYLCRRPQIRPHRPLTLRAPETLPRHYQFVLAS